MPNINKLYPSSGLVVKEAARWTDELEAPSDEDETTEAPGSLVAPPPLQHPPAPGEVNKEKTARDDDDGDAAAAADALPTFKDQVRVSLNDPQLQGKPLVGAQPAAADPAALLPAYKDQARVSPNEPRLQGKPLVGEQAAADPAAAPALLPNFKD